MLRSYVRSGAILQRSKTIPEKQDMGVLGVAFPLTLMIVQTNYNGLQTEIDKQTSSLLGSFMPQLRQSGQRAFQTLVGYRNETINNNEQFREMQQDASNQTQNAVDRVQSQVGTLMNVTKGIRDFSADALLVGAGFLSGGTAVAFVGGGSLLKGTFTFEDKKMAGQSTGNAVAAGGIEAASDLVVGLVGIGTGATVKAAVAARTTESKVAAGTMVLIGAQIDGTTEFAKAVVDGKTVHQALRAAAVDAVLNAGGALAAPVLDSAFSSAALGRLSFPITVSKTNHELVSVSELAVNSAGSFLSDKIVEAVSSNEQENSAAWHQSLACTWLPLGDSDLVYVEQHAMRRAGR
jgi:hypothetical protein